MGNAIRNLDKEELKSRKPSIGYIPGNLKDICETFSGYIQLMFTNIDKESIFNYSQKTLGISTSSANSFITTLVNIDFLTEKLEQYVFPQKQQKNG